MILTSPWLTTKVTRSPASTPSLSVLRNRNLSFWHHFRVIRKNSCHCIHITPLSLISLLVMLLGYNLLVQNASDTPSADLTPSFIGSSLLSAGLQATSSRGQCPDSRVPESHAGTFSVSWSYSRVAEAARHARNRDTRIEQNRRMRVTKPVHGNHGNVECPAVALQTVIDS